MPKFNPLDRCILYGYRGSISHGTYLPGSNPHSVDDQDVIGVCVSPQSYYLGLDKFEQEEKFEGSLDSVIYDIKKMFSMLLKSNPNVVSTVWMKPDMYIKKDDLGDLMIDNREIFSSQRAYHSFLGYANAQLREMNKSVFQGYMGSKRKAMVEEFGYDCYDEETEFLTSTGWKKFDDVGGEDMLATVDIESNDLIFSRYNNKIDKLYSGNMYIIEPYLSKCIVTENHNLLVSDVRRGPLNNWSTKYCPELSNWRLQSVKSLIDGHRSFFHIRRSPNKKEKEYGGTTDNYLKLMGLYLSDGTAQFRNGKLKSIKISQKKNGNLRKIANEISESFNLRYYDYEKESIWILHGEVAKQIYKDCGHKSSKKKLPKWCFSLSKYQMNILWESLMSGDGYRTSQRDIYYTSSKDLADSIQAALIMSGNQCAVNGPYKHNTSFGKTEMYQVTRSNITNNIHYINFNTMLLHGQPIINKKEGHPVKQIKVKNKRVVCFEVPTGTLITRHSGKVAIHGNCKHASHCIRLLRMGIEFVETGVLNVDRTNIDAQELIDIKLGKYKLEDIKKEAEKLFTGAKKAIETTPLPKEPDYDKANELLVHIITEYNKRNP